MKKKLFTLVSVLFFVVTAKSQITHTIDFSINNLILDTITISTNTTYTTVKYSGLNNSMIDFGLPDLPVKTLHLIIPFGQDITSVSCSNVITQNYSINYQVYPTDSCDLYGRTFACPNTLIYNSSNKFPDNPVMSWNQNYFDGNNNIVSIGICPFEYYPSLGQLKLITSVTLVVTYNAGNVRDVLSIQRLQKTQNLYDSILYHMVENPEMIPLYQIPSVIVDELGVTSTGLPVYEYVVITPRYFASSMRDFVTWKIQKGYRAGIAQSGKLVIMR